MGQWSSLVKKQRWEPNSLFLTFRFQFWVAQPYFISCHWISMRSNTPWACLSFATRGALVAYLSPYTISCLGVGAKGHNEMTFISLWVVHHICFPHTRHSCYPQTYSATWTTEVTSLQRNLLGSTCDSQSQWVLEQVSESTSLTHSKTPTSGQSFYW